MIYLGDCLEVLNSLPEGCAQTCVTSPPYWGLRDYGVEGQLGLEKTPELFVQKMVEVFRAVRRVLKNDGTLWLNLGDSYSASQYGSGGGWAQGKGKNGSGGNSQERSLFKDPGYNAELPNKNLVGIPWRVALALQADGWILRQDIIWHKPNPMPESVRDRCTKAHEYIFLLAKSPRYYFDHESLREPAVVPAGPGNKRAGKEPGLRQGDNANIRGSLHRIGPRATRHKRSVWSVTTKPFRGAHFARFPPDLIEPCVRAGAPTGGVVLDPFAGAGTTGVVCKRTGREFIGIELNPEYRELALRRIDSVTVQTELKQLEAGEG